VSLEHQQAALQQPHIPNHAAQNLGLVLSYLGYAFCSSRTIIHQQQEHAESIFSLPRS
jgi:hypothetical protein